METIQFSCSTTTEKMSLTNKETDKFVSLFVGGVLQKYFEIVSEVMNELKVNECCYDVHMFYKPYESKCSKNNYRYWVVNGNLHMVCVALKECIDTDNFPASGLAGIVRSLAKTAGLDITLNVHSGLVIRTRQSQVNVKSEQININEDDKFVSLFVTGVLQKYFEIVTEVMNELKVDECYYNVHMFYKPYESKCSKNNYRYWLVSDKLHMICFALKQCIDTDNFSASSLAELVRSIAKNSGLNITLNVHSGLVINTRSPPVTKISHIIYDKFELH